MASGLLSFIGGLAGGDAGSALTLLGPACALCSSLTWAYGSSVYTREASRVGAMEVNLSRAVIVLPLFLIAAVIMTGRAALADLDGARLGWLIVSALCSYGIGDMMFYLSAMRLGTPTALAIASVYPVWSALLGALTLGERIGPSQLIGTLLCVVGVVWLVLLQSQDPSPDVPRPTSPTDDPVLAKEPVAPKRRFGLAGVGLAVLTSLLWAGNTYSIRRGSVGLPLFVVNTIRYAMAAAFLIAALGWQRWRARSTGTSAEKPDSQRLLTSPARLRRFAVTAVIEAFVGSSVFVYGLSHSPLSVAAPLSSLAPLFAVPIGVLMGVERLHLRRIVAILITVGGVVLLVR